jgi:hypothetical protein
MYDAIMPAFYCLRIFIKIDIAKFYQDLSILSKFRDRVTISGTLNEEMHAIISQLARSSSERKSRFE